MRVLFMQSDGGLTPTDRFIGSRAVLSGPAGGVVGYAMTTSEEEEGPVIGFDMGGTSTDVSRFDGDYEHVFESTTAGVAVYKHLRYNTAVFSFCRHPCTNPHCIVSHDPMSLKAFVYLLTSSLFYLL